MKRTQCYYFNASYMGINYNLLNRKEKHLFLMAPFSCFRKLLGIINTDFFFLWTFSQEFGLGQNDWCCTLSRLTSQHISEKAPKQSQNLSSTSVKRTAVFTPLSYSQRNLALYPIFRIKSPVPRNNPDNMRKKNIKPVWLAPSLEFKKTSVDTKRLSY